VTPTGPAAAPGHAPEALRRLATTRLFVLDLDGTVYLGNRVFPWTLPFLEAVRASGRDYLFLTNNSSRGAADYVRKLATLGIPAEPRQVFTSGQATVELLAREGTGRRVYVLGTPELVAEFERGGFQVDERDPDWLVMGFDTTLTYAKLERFCALLREGRRFVATHPDLVCPTERGPIPDIGGTLALAEAVTGRRPERIVGKPNPGILQAVSLRTGVPLEHLAMVGDRLYTDVRGGLDAGCLAVLVLSGETTCADLDSARFRPHLVVENLSELKDLLA
jgi:HAD superfamily hydrolase (TIGR01450 family)